MEPRFGLDFFSSFDLVLNGLDNMNARRCANTPAMDHHEFQQERAMIEEVHSTGGGVSTSQQNA
jgi:hypothetical protein